MSAGRVQLRLLGTYTLIQFTCSFPIPTPARPLTTHHTPHTRALKVDFPMQISRQCLCSPTLYALSRSVCNFLALPPSLPLSLSLSVSVSVSVSLSLSICLCLSLSVAVSLCLSLYVSVSLCLCLSLSLSLSVSVSLYLSLSLSLPLSLSFCVCVCICMCIYITQDM